MQSDHSGWENWAHILQHWGLQEFAAALLEASGPLTIILAQFLYAARPFFPGNRLVTLANLFENPEEGRMFATFLREGRIA